VHKTSILSLASLALAALPASASLIGTATITPSQIDATHYHYDLVLNDTGTTTIGTFWFAWKPGQDYMPVQPTDILSPANWTEMVTAAGAGDGFAIQWVAAAGSELAAGASLAGFSFRQHSHACSDRRRFAILQQPTGRDQFRLQPGAFFGCRL
jgi:hypothetical protein